MMADPPQILFIGGGGHARVLLDALREMGDKRRVGVLDQDPQRAGSTLLDAPVLGGDELLDRFVREGSTAFVVAVGGTSNNRPRSALFERAVQLGLEPVTIVHPRAIVSRWATIGAGTQILAGAIVNAGARLGTNVIVNTAAVVEHDCIVGDHVHIATGACLASTVRVDERAHVGAGAVVRQLISIGAEGVVGAGAVVVKNVAAGCVVAGVPAKELQR